MARRKSDPLSRSRQRRALGFALVLALFALGATQVPLREPLTAFGDWLRAAGTLGVLGYTLAYVLGALVLVPGALLAAPAALAYGPGWGILSVSLAATLASAAGFVLGRGFARDWVLERATSSVRLSALVGIAIGGVGAMLLARSMQSLFFGIEWTDAWSFGAAAVSLLAVTLVATFIPAAHAARVSPLLVLRGE
jgi:hypothetical protein